MAIFQNGIETINRLRSITTNPVIAGNITSVASLTAVTVNGSDLEHADIDTNTAAGDLVQILSGTGVTTGVYRITAVGANAVTVDRAPGGAGTNIVLTIYKDIIFFGATDATNGQRIMNYSHQNKPLQIGGDTLVATVSMTGEDVTLAGLWGVDVSAGQLVGIDADVAHGMTDIGITSAYAIFAPISGTVGGLDIYGLTDLTQAGALRLTGIIGAADPTDTHPALVLRGGKSNGTTWQALGAAETVMQWMNYTTVAGTLLGNGYLGLGAVTAPSEMLDLIGNIELNSGYVYFTQGAYGIFDVASGQYGFRPRTSSNYASVLIANTEVVRIAAAGLGVGATPIYTIDANGAINSRVYYNVEEFDDEVTGTQFESGHRASAWVTAGTNYAAANVTYTVGPGGTLKAMCAAADNDSVTVLGVLNANVTQNPILEARIKIDTKETAAFYVGFVSAAFADVNGAFPNDAFLVGINSDNGHGFGATRVVAASVDNGAAVVYDDMGVAIVSNTYITIKIDLTDTEQPRVWINNSEIGAGSITGTVQDGVALAPYFMVQNLAGGAIQRFITLDYIKVWEDRG